MMRIMIMVAAITVAVLLEKTVLLYFTVMQIELTKHWIRSRFPLVP